MHVSLRIEQRAVEFDLTYAANFVADVNTRVMLGRDGGCEPEVTHLLFRVLGEGDVAVDGGANIGFFSLLMARLVGATGKVLAFEPGANNISKLRENVALNRLDNVEVVEAALWHRQVVLDFYLCVDSGENAAWKSDAALGATAVSGVKLSDYLRESKIKLIKLDVEGSEQRALEGAYAHLAKYTPFIVCELNAPAMMHLGDSQASLRKLMMGFGYDLFVLHADGRLPSLVPPGSVVEPTAVNTNVLFSRANKLAEAWPVVQA